MARRHVSTHAGGQVYLGRTIERKEATRPERARDCSEGGGPSLEQLGWQLSAGIGQAPADDRRLPMTDGGLVLREAWRHAQGHVFEGVGSSRRTSRHLTKLK